MCEQTKLCESDEQRKFFVVQREVQISVKEKELNAVEMSVGIKVVKVDDLSSGEEDWVAEKLKCSPT